MHVTTVRGRWYDNFPNYGIIEGEFRQELMSAATRRDGASY